MVKKSFSLDCFSDDQYIASVFHVDLLAQPRGWQAVTSGLPRALWGLVLH